MFTDQLSENYDLLSHRLFFFCCIRQIRDTVKVHNVETGKEKEFDVTIKLANDNLNLSQIFDYCQKGVTSAIPQTEIQATDIALRSGLTNNL